LLKWTGKILLSNSFDDGPSHHAGDRIAGRTCSVVLTAPLAEEPLDSEERPPPVARDNELGTDEESDPEELADAFNAGLRGYELS
jgi:hypothetical protein